MVIGAAAAVLCRCAGSARSPRLSLQHLRVVACGFIWYDAVQGGRVMAKKKDDSVVTMSIRLPRELRDTLGLVAAEMPGMSINSLIVWLVQTSEPQLLELVKISQAVKRSSNPAGLYERMEAILRDAERGRSAWSQVQELADREARADEGAAVK